MKSSWLIKTNSKKLILFFNGWSLDENIVKHLDSDNYDVLMFYDYANLEISQELLVEIGTYKETNIIAWSFGVWACNAIMNKFNRLKNIIAINGTPIAIDDNFGIPEKIFNLTLSNLSEKNYLHFYKNMFANFEERFLGGLSNRCIENQRQELVQIQDLASEFGVIKQHQQFNKVFVGALDKIIPAKNQMKFWSQNEELQIVELNEGHYIFNLFESWDEIIDYE